MDRIVDKVIVLICCAAALFLMQQTTVIIVGLLLALAISSLQETSLLSKTLAPASLYAYLVLALVVPGLSVFVPLIAYDCFRKQNWFLKVCWIAPLVAAVRGLTLEVLFFLVVVSLISCCLSWRTERIETERNSYRVLRDELREVSLSLEQKNRDLQEKQDYEVKLATLAERGRIAREIHDNVGHLLTRSVLQIEAAQVVHANEPQIKTDLEQIGTTVHEAFDTVRASVHDLHDDSFDLYTQLYAIARNSSLEVAIEYQVDEVPDIVGYGFVAIVRESIANTVKHSNASRTKVAVTEYPAFWQLVVHDNGNLEPFRTADKGTYRSHGDGVGAKLSAEVNHEKASGIGLKTMEERARSLGGVFRVDSDRGFRVFVSVPKEERA